MYFNIRVAERNESRGATDPNAHLQWKGDIIYKLGKKNWGMTGQHDLGQSPRACCTKDLMTKITMYFNGDLIVIKSFVKWAPGTYNGGLENAGLKKWIKPYGKTLFPT